MYLAEKRRYINTLPFLSFPVCTKVQMVCIWSSLCQFHPINSCFIKIQNGLTFLVPAYTGCPEKEAVKWMSVCLQHQREKCTPWLSMKNAPDETWFNHCIPLTMKNVDI